MALPTAQAVASKWVSRTSAAAQDYAEGVAKTDVDPTQRAVASQARMRQRILEAIDSGRWAQGLQRVGVQGWKNAVATKGVQNFGTGVAAAESKVAQAFGPLLAFEASLKATIDAMPNVTDADRNNRMLAWANGMRQYQAP